MGGKALQPLPLMIAFMTKTSHEYGLARVIVMFGRSRALCAVSAALREYQKYLSIYTLVIDLVLS